MQSLRSPVIVHVCQRLTCNKMLVWYFESKCVYYFAHAQEEGEEGNLEAIQSAPAIAR